MGCEARTLAVRGYRTPSPDAAHSGASLEQLPRVSMTDTVVFLGVEYPDPGPIGVHMYYQGWGYEVRSASIDLSDGTRNSLTIGSALSIVSALRRAGYQARQGAFERPPPLAGARFALLGRVVDLRVQSAGGTGPHRISAETQVSWEILDLSEPGRGIGLRTYGRAQTRDSIAETVLRSVDSALVALLADFRFRIAVGRPAAGGPWASEVALPAVHPAAGVAGPIELSPSGRSDLDTGDVALRVAAGVVTLRGVERFEESAFILTRDGIALAALRAVQGASRVWVRFPNGVERRAEVLRRSPEYGVALIHVPCPGPCPTVPWTLEPEAGLVPIISVRAPAGFDAAPAFGSGEALGRPGQSLRRLFATRLSVPVHGGEPLARARDGTVFAVAVPWRSTTRGVVLEQALQSMEVFPDVANQPRGAPAPAPH